MQPPEFLLNKSPNIFIPVFNQLANQIYGQVQFHGFAIPFNRHPVSQQDLPAQLIIIFYWLTIDGDNFITVVDAHLYKVLSTTCTPYLMEAVGIFLSPHIISINA
jgi:hypothetical protein